jgi:DNA mismatch endonuclease (patch repair protein)
MKKKTPKRTAAEQRHYTMSRIKSKDTSIEVAFRKALWHKGIRYRKNYKNLPGTPDIVITKYKIVIFCDGDFWHGKDWDSKKESIQSNRDYWFPKIERNMERDMAINNQLEKQGWLVLRFWGKDIQKNIAACLKDVEEAIIQAKTANFEAHYYDPAVSGEQETPTAAEQEPEYE